jgi:N-acetylglucosaminyl-diphospho-decaprenol L-rhamnosyltransferase
MISIVIVNWNSGPLLERCVQSLLRGPRVYEIIVVDNASADVSLDFLAKMSYPLTLLRNAENVGFAAGNNRGWRFSRGDQVLFLNPDTESTPGAVERLESLLVEDRSIWAAGGKLVSPDGIQQSGFNVRSFPDVGSVAAEMLLLDEVWPDNPWTRRYRMRDLAGSSAQDVDQPAAACLMVQRSALAALDGFDESFVPAWFEDVDLCRRIRGLGGRIVFEPAAQFVHHGGSSLKHLARGEFLEYFHSNQVQYFRKHHGTESAERVRRLVRWGMYLRAAVSLVRPLICNASRMSSARTFWRTARYFGRGGA